MCFQIMPSRLVLPSSAPFSGEKLDVIARLWATKSALVRIFHAHKQAIRKVQSAHAFMQATGLMG